jgi:hypothetical protein
MASLRNYLLPPVRDLRSGQRAALLSVAVSTLAAVLIVVFAIQSAGPYRSWGGLIYASGFLLVAIGTCRLSRVAAVAAFLLYFSMSSKVSTPLHFLFYLVVYVGLVTAIRAAFLFRRLPKSQPNTIGPTA